MRSEKLKYIGICLSTLHEEDRYNFVRALNGQAAGNGYRLIVFNCCSDLYGHNEADNAGSAAVYRLVPHKHLDAVIIMPNIMYSPDGIQYLIESCKEKNVPLISVDHKLEDGISVFFSYADIFEHMCRHVIVDHGAKNVYMMAGFRTNVYSEERIAAFKKVMTENGLPVEEDKIGYGNFWEQPTIDTMRQWFETEKRDIPDAIICANDIMAITTCTYLQQHGVKVPEDCIVTGFDGIRRAELLPPTITTCKQDFDGMAKLIMDIIQRTAAGEDMRGEHYVDFTLSYAQSCGCCKKGNDSLQDTIYSLVDSVRLSDDRQKMLTFALYTIPQLPGIEEMPPLFIEKSRFTRFVWALNKKIFEPPYFGENYRGANSYSDEVDIIYQHYDGVTYPTSTIKREDLLPSYEMFAECTDPIIVCSANFTDQVMGYCAYQTKLDVDDYDKLHCIMSALGSALGSFKGRMQIRNMNRELMEVNAELKRMSQRDFMTGLYNRRGFFDKLGEELESGRIHGATLIFISADLDGLKYINDTFGHAEGDNAIITVGRALLSCSLNNEICSRFGGDEFGLAAAVRDTDPDAFYEDYKNRFMEYLEKYNASSGKPYKVQASIGYYYDVVDGDLDTDEMIRSADAMMYAYKQEHKKARGDLSGCRR